MIMPDGKGVKFWQSTPVNAENNADSNSSGVRMSAGFGSQARLIRQVKQTVEIKRQENNKQKLAI
jgi:hypothetical protein